MSTSRWQFSIRDLLGLMVVFAIFAALLPMLMAYNNSRPGRNPQCKNNLAQLAKAANVYLANGGAYPGYHQDLAGRGVPWPIELLPQLDRLDLFVEWSNPALNPPATPRLQTYLELMVCPRDGPDVLSGPHNSYVANAGIVDHDNLNRANGVFVDRTRAEGITTDDIIDGTTHTLLFSENIQATTWIAPGKRDTVFLWHPVTTPTAGMCINGGNLKSPLTAQSARPSSHHRGGVNVAFADTHVVFLNEDIDYKVYMQMMTPNGAQSDMPAKWKDFGLTESGLRQ